MSVPTLEEAALPKKLKNKADLLAFARAHSDWFLERCRGVRFYSWWWMRSEKRSSDIVMVDGRATSKNTLEANFIVDRAKSDTFGNSTVYRLKKK